MHWTQILILSAGSGAVLGLLSARIVFSLYFVPFPLRPLFAWKPLGVLFRFSLRLRSLAVRIGVMAAGELLRPALLRQALLSARFKEALGRAVETRLGAFLEKNRSSLAAELPAFCRPYLRLGAQYAGRRAADMLMEFLRTDAGADFGTALVRAQLHAFVCRRTQEDASAADGSAGFAAMPDFLAAGFFAEADFQGAIAACAAGRLEALRRETRSFGEILPQEIIGFLQELAERVAPWLVGQLAAMAAAPDVRRALAKKLCQVAQGCIDSLGPLGILSGAFLGPEGLEQKIAGYLGARWERLIDIFIAEGGREKAREFLLAQIEIFLRTPVAEMMAELPRQGLERAVSLGAGSFAAILREPETATACVRLVEGMLRRRLNGDNADLVSPALFRELRAFLLARQPQKIIALALSSLFETALTKALIGALNEYFPAGMRRAFSSFLKESLLQMLQKELPVFLEALDLSSMLTKKIDAADFSGLKALRAPRLRARSAIFSAIGAAIGLLFGLANGLLIVLAAAL